MIIQTLRRAVVSDKNVAHFCQILCSIVAGVVMVFGIRRLAQLDFTETELFSAMTGTLLLSGLFVVLGFQCRAWRRG